MNCSKKIISMLLASTMTFGLAGCSAVPVKIVPPTSDTKNPATAVEATDIHDEATDAVVPEPAEGGLKIAIITSPNDVEDGTFNEANYNGARAFVESRNNIDVLVPIQEYTGDGVAAVKAVADAADDYDVLLCISYLFGGIASVAQEHPNTAFVLVDAFPSDAEFNTVEVDNIYAMNFAEQESGFFAGIAAAMETKTGKVAVVNGIAYPSNVNYQYGFESGVNYAVKHLEAQAEIVELEEYAGVDVTGNNIGGNYINDFVDEDKGKAVGNALIDQGVDILFVAAGGAGNGVLTAVKESDAADMVIGSDVDQYDDGVNGDENIILTSALKNMAINIERQLNAVAEGDFQGENLVLYADTDSTGYVSEPGRHQMSDKTLAALAEVYPLVKDQTVQPAANFSGTTPDAFPGL